MTPDSFTQHFGGIERLYGETTARAFADAHIVVAGLGGVGSWAAEALARSGIGALTLIDMDEICVTNTNRQLHTLANTIGRSKVEVMAERLQAINPECRVTAVMQFVTLRNMEQVLPRECDAVVDAIDSVNHKAALLANCRRRKQWVICAGGAGGQTDPTRIRVADLSRTTQDPLLAKVRNLLRREYGFSRNPKRRFNIPAIYSEEQLTYPTPEGGTTRQKPSDGPTRLDCSSGFGAASFVTGTFGFVAASKVLEQLARRHEKMRAKADTEGK